MRVVAENRDEKRGTIVVETRTPLMIRTQIIGHFGLDMANDFMALLDDWAGTRTGLHSFHDCTQIDDYDVKARERLTAWSRAHIGQFAAVHMLVQRRTIAWGLQVMAVLVGAKLVVHHSRGAFEDALAKVVARSPRSSR